MTNKKFAPSEIFRLNGILEPINWLEKDSEK
jgi:hypothetical protein